MLNFPVYEGGLCALKGICVYFSYGIPETVEWVHHGESFYVGETKNNRWNHAMSCLLPGYTQTANEITKEKKKKQNKTKTKQNS